MEINIKDREYFKDNIAIYKDLGEVQILDFKIPNSFYKSLRYVFDKKNMYVSGDYGTAVFELTWHGTPFNFTDINIGYFLEKLSAYHEEKAEFNNEMACEGLEESFEQFIGDNFEDLVEYEEELKNLERKLLKLKSIKDSDEDIKEEIEEYIQLISELEENIEQEKSNDEYQKLRETFDELKYVAENCSSCSEWAGYVNNSDSLEMEYIRELDSDYYDWIYTVGDDVPSRVKIYLMGLVLSGEQLSKEKEM